MNKKLVLLLTFIVSFIVSIGVVRAEDEKDKTCKDITCTYDKGYCVFCSQKKTVITQKKDCTINVKYGDDKVSNYSMQNVNDNNTGYAESAKELVDCPPCMDYNSGTINFTIKKKNSVSCPNSYLPITSVGGEEGKKKEEEKKEQQEKQEKDTITNLCKDWLEVCEYKSESSKYTYKFRVLVSQSKFEIVLLNGFSYDSNWDKIVTDDIAINNFFSNGKVSCPLYLYYTPPSDAGTHMGGDSFIFGINKKPKSIAFVGYETLCSETDTSTNNGSSTIIDNGSENSCNDLFSGNSEVLKIIDEIMGYVRIIVPILLLIFGVTDFFKSIFSGSEDNMKQNRDRFIKRLIAAVIVFLVPVFVHLVLKIANQVWPNISPETCVKDN